VIICPPPGEFDGVLGTGFVVLREPTGNYRAEWCAAESILPRALERATCLVVIDCTRLGPSWIAALRERGVTVGVLCVGSRGAPPSATDVLGAGADDYLARPYDLGELQARLEALLRRCPPSPSAPHVVATGSGDQSGFFRVPAHRRGDGLVRVDTSLWELKINGRSVSLRPAEFKILRHLMDHRHRIVSAQELLSQVLGTHGCGGTVRNHVLEIRKAFRAASAPDPICTTRGAGYRFVGEDTTAKDSVPPPATGGERRRRNG
jgi:two-component system alkaline phosphatase synthesis response regulator PhoP